MKYVNMKQNCINLGQNLTEGIITDATVEGDSDSVLHSQNVDSVSDGNQYRVKCNQRQTELYEFTDYGCNIIYFQTKIKNTIYNMSIRY